MRIDHEQSMPAQHSQPRRSGKCALSRVSDSLSEKFSVLPARSKLLHTEYKRMRDGR
jgi:hypothetical protein